MRSFARLFLLPTVLLSWQAGALALDPVVLQLKWRHQFQFAGYYAAIAQGYYREAGLDVTLREAEPGHDPMHTVLEGKADFGVGTSNILLLRAHGEPIVVLAVIYQHSPFVLLTRRESGLQDIHGLAEHPIMMEPDAAELLAYFKSEGVEASELKIKPHTFDVRDLITKRVTSMSAYSTDEPFHLKAAGEEYQVFSPRASGIDFYGDNLFTTEDQIKKHPERVRSFLQASLRGWEYAMKHPEEMVDLILRDYNRGKTREQLLFEAEETARLIHPELIELGYINPGRWENIAHTYADLGMIPDKFPLKDFIYQRNPSLDLRWLYWVAAVLGAVLLGAAGWALMETRLNHRLRREVVARRQAEDMLKKESADKTRFLAILAHEVRTPLSGILSSLWLFKESPVQKERDEVVDIAESSAKNLLLMVDNMLDHAKLENGRMETELLRVHLAQFLREICDLFRAAAMAKSLDFSCEIDPAVPPVIFTDPMRLRQILSNLLSNAVKFTEKGSIHLHVAAEAEPEKPDFQRLFFRVSDTGPGLTEGQATRIFQPYAQGDSSVARYHGGTGLGLSISTQLAHLLGGKITVANQPEAGAIFTLSILGQTEKR